MGTKWSIFIIGVVVRLKEVNNISKYAEITSPLFGILIIIVGIFLMELYNSISAGFFDMNDFIGWSIPFGCLGLYGVLIGIANTFSPSQPNL
jgi:hypothetical protein